jgi:quercetin dioxygenase-like cupin family protein
MLGVEPTLPLIGGRSAVATRGRGYAHGVGSLLITEEGSVAEVTDAAAFGLAADEGEAYWFAGQLATVKIGGDQTQGKWTLVEFEGPPGNGPPLHVHHNDGESFYILEGEITFYVGDAVIEARAGSFAVAPQGVPHTFVIGGQTPPATS